MRRPLTARERQILRFCQQPRTRKEVLAELELGFSRTNSARYLAPLVAEGFLAYTLPDAINSRQQQYMTTAKGLQAVQ